MADAHNTILSCAMLTLGSTVGSHVMPTSVGGRGELPPPRLLIGTSLTFIGLSMLADPYPRLAGPLAITIAVTALTYYGVPLADNVFNGGKNRVGFRSTARQGVKAKVNGQTIKVDTGDILGTGGFTTP